jgi:uncharacterized UPF0146 family protein
MEEAERSDGWLQRCEDSSVFVACAQELVEALTEALAGSPPPILEVGAGSGQLATELRRRNVPVLATDPKSTDGDVITLDAEDALRIYNPATVFSSFLPVDAGIESQILQCASVQRYLYIGPKIMGRVGPQSLWNVPGWRTNTLSKVEACLISRLDVLLDFNRGTHQRGAGAVLFHRTQ